jgi:peptide subunit release factor 1 (eRF1)
MEQIKKVILGGQILKKEYLIQKYIIDSLKTKKVPMTSD